MPRSKPEPTSSSIPTPTTSTNADDIPQLVKPLLDRRAEIVVGARPIDQIEHFSPIKKFLQKLGSRIVQIASNTDIPDCTSGFRAVTREAALNLNVFSEYTYTLETIIQAGQKGIKITSVPIRTNDDLRPSRLVKSISSYVRRSMVTILRIFLLYRPLRFFLTAAMIPLTGGVILCVRWLILALIDTSSRTSHTPSMIVAAVLLILAFQLASLGLAADLITANRKLLEDIRVRLRRQELNKP